MNRRACREHRIPGSLERTVGDAPTTPEVIAALVRRARRAGVIVFMRDELERLPDISRALIESEHRRICERR